MPRFLQILGAILMLCLFIGPAMTAIEMIRSFSQITEGVPPPTAASLAPDIALALNLTLIGIPLGILGLALFVIGSCSIRSAREVEDRDLQQPD